VVDAAAVPTERKVAWVREADETARGLGAEIRQVSATYADSVQRLLIATSDGRWVEETRPRVRLSVSAVAGRDDTIQTGFHGPAGLAGAEFMEANPPSTTAEVAARRDHDARRGAGSRGETAAVLAPGMGGVLFHEAVGHPLGRISWTRRRACTAAGSGAARRRDLSGVDDATGAERLGFVLVRRRGRRPATVLFENGVRADMLDRLRAERRMRLEPERSPAVYAHPPIPRMTNTYILNGSSTPEAILADTERGVLVTALAGGQTNPPGDFVFGCRGLI
jgi:TldD protein